MTGGRSSASSPPTGHRALTRSQSRPLQRSQQGGTASTPAASTGSPRPVPSSLSNVFSRGRVACAASRRLPAWAALRSYRRRPGLRCGRPDPCLFCNRDPWAEDVQGCVDVDVRGRSRVPLSWPPDLGIEDDNPCSCGAQVGFLHHYGCALEDCPWTADHPDDGGQLLFCGCWAPDDAA